MNLVLNTILIGASGLLFIMIWLLVARKRLDLRYALLWLATAFVLLLTAAIPPLPARLSELLGFEVSSNFVFFVIIGFLLLICISYSIALTTTNRKMNALIQHVAIADGGEAASSAAPRFITAKRFSALKTFPRTKKARRKSIGNSEPGRLPLMLW